MKETMKQMKLWPFAVILVACGLTFLTACTDNNDTTVDPTVGQISGIDPKNFDLSVRPADDFYQYACGGWIKNNPLPASYSSWGSFDELSDENNKRIRGILDDLQQGSYAKGTTEQKLCDLYKLAMDTERRNREGVEPVMHIIRQLEQAATKEELQQVCMQLAPTGYFRFISVDICPDIKDSKQNILNVEQGGLMLDQKEYYVGTDAANISIREAYRQHIVSMLQLFGFSEEQATQKMTNILRIETELAKVSRTKTELRDPEANYNKTTLAEFEATYPHLQFEKTMNACGLASALMQQFVVGQPEFLAGVDQLLGIVTTDELRDYTEWSLVVPAAKFLDEKTEATYFDFFGRVLMGRQEDYPLWKIAIEQIEDQMGEALGKVYVEKYFPEAAKQRMLQLVRNLQNALSERIEAQDWMSSATKAAAQEKLATFIVKVGYPDKWTDMSRLNIDPEKSYYENMQACLRFWMANDIENKAGKPVDNSVWEMYPQTVNAYYEPPTNEICFPAGILQYPFFDMEADDAFNYGCIGVVIGHEMTHGFDDTGRKYDKDGNLYDWWTAEDDRQFKERTDMFADFFSAIEVLPGLHANGRMTLGENLADHGGLQVAWTAYKKATLGQTLPMKDGYTADQRFFLAHAHIWGQNLTEERIRFLTQNDVHSLGRWRINGALPHIDAWYEAFDVKEGDKLFIPKEKRLSLW